MALHGGTPQAAKSESPLRLAKAKQRWKDEAAKTDAALNPQSASPTPAGTNVPAGTLALVRSFLAFAMLKKASAL
jgi:hypothetical protein